MATKAKPLIRDINPILAKIRNWVLGHTELKLTHRYEGYEISKRTQPPPNMPPGVSAKLSENYYVYRDGRRICDPPTAVYVASSQKMIEGDKSAAKKIITPGVSYNWSSGEFNPAGQSSGLH